MSSPKSEGQRTFAEMVEVLLPEAKQIKLVPITSRDKCLIDDFLGHFQAGIQGSLSREIELSRTMQTEALSGQIKFHRAQLATIKMLRGINWQRKEKPLKAK